MPAKPRTKQVTFSRLRAVSRDLVYMATAPDGQELATPFVGLCQYDAGHWSYETFDCQVADMALFKAADTPYRIMCMLAEDGRMINIDTKASENVKAATRESGADWRLGYLLRIRQIGQHLYVTGDGGQNYRRADDGTWSVLDPSLFNGPSRSLELGGMLLDAETPEEIAEAVRQARADDSNRLSGLAGLDDDTIYICSEKGQVFWFDGSRFVPVPVEVEDAALLDVLVEAPDRVWVCGRRGTLLVGNRRDGFRAAPGIDVGASFSRMTLFNGTLHLGAYANPRGLFVYEGGRLRRVRSGLTPDLEDVNMIEAVDDVLWVMGTKDLLRFDGQRWERIAFPGNDPVR